MSARRKVMKVMKADESKEAERKADEGITNDDLKRAEETGRAR